MAYKITKYRGKHKIKDTKSGKSVNIDIEKYMNGGGKKKKTKKKEDLSEKQAQDIRDSTGVEFTQEGANQLFETIDPASRPETPEFNLGRYRDVGYFNVDYRNGAFNVSPTKRNPGNYNKYKEYLKYLQEQNPDVRINRRANNDGYLPFENRLEYGGSFHDLISYMNGGEKKDKKKKKLSSDQVRDIRDSTGVEFTSDGANQLFETIDPVSRPVVPDFDLGRYRDVGYFNVDYKNNEFNISPTKRNPGNYAKYKEYLDYLQEQNPDVTINRTPNRNGYLPVNKRTFAMGGPGDKDKKLSEKQAQDIRDSTGVEFTQEGANTLFQTVDPALAPDVPEFNLGRYKNVGYFNIGYSNGEFNVSPTKRNPGNYAKHKEYLDYLQEQNPDVRINRRANNDGYLPVRNRLEYGGKMITVPKYMLGTEMECPPGDVQCQEQKRLQSTTQIVPQDRLSQERQDFINGQKSSTTTAGIVEEGSPAAQISASTPNEVTNTLTEQQESHFSSPYDISDKVQAGPSSSPSDAPSPNYNLFNPYAGADIPGAANYLGQSIKNKNTFGAVAAGLKVAAGLGRNIVSGLGQANRYNQVMEDYYKDQKNNKNPVQYQANGGKLDTFAYGGKKDEELATGEYMHGIMNPDTENYNAEIEKGEYFQTNQGDIAEVVGDKHSQGGEKIQMEEEDRVLSDKLKLGGKNAKMLSEKYGLKLKAKNTYSTVLDRFRTKSKLNKILDEESEILKKISDQDKVEDDTTKSFNLKVLAKKKQEVEDRKHPIEEQRKEIFDELFDLQEDSKPAFERTGNEFEKGGRLVPKYENGVKIGDIDPITGKKVTKAEAKRKVESGEWEALGGDRYIDRGTAGTEAVSDRVLQSYRETWDREKFPVFKDYVNAAEQWKIDHPDWNKNHPQGTPGVPDRFFYTRDPQVQGQTAPPVLLDNEISYSMPDRVYVPPTEPADTRLSAAPSERALSGAYLFPDESPLPPSSLQGTIKPVARFDRLRANEIEVRPYLQDIKDREASQVQSLEGLSPNVRAAVLANVRANSQTQESSIRNQIDAQNLSNRQRVEDANAQIQRREGILENNYRQGYEERIYTAQANTDNDLRNYYNSLQELNSQRFMDIHNLNLSNAQDESIYFDGQNFRRKEGQANWELLGGIRRKLE